MTGEELRKEIAKGKIRPVYLLAGDEALLRDDALAMIREAVVSRGAADFNHDRLAGEATSPAALQDAVKALPVMAPQRLVELREPEGGRGAAAKELPKALADVITWVCGQEQTVLLVSASKVDRRSRWVKAIAEPAVVVDCASPSNSRSLGSFLKQEARRQEVKIEADAAELLAERVGPQLMVLRQEIAKAALLAGPGEPITRAQVEVGTARVADEPIWDLTDAIGAGHTADALSVLKRLLASGAPSPVILGSLASHFRKLARARSGGRVAGPPFAVKKLEQQARRYRVARLRACLGAIHQADLALKGASSLPPELTLERLVLGLSA